MATLLSILAGLISAFCFGLAILLEQVATRQVTATNTLDPRQLVQFARRWQYSLGIILDVFGWFFSVVAIRRLPLFFAQAMIAMSLVVTIVIGAYYFNAHPTKHDKQAVVLILLGVLLLGITAVPESAVAPKGPVDLILVLALLPIAAIAISILTFGSKDSSVVSLSVLAGATLGICAIIARIIVVPHSLIEAMMNLQIYILGVYSVFGMLLFSKALQRGDVNKVNGSLVAGEVLLPTIIGVVFLGDQIHRGLWPIMVVGCAMVVIGTIVFVHRPIN